MSTGRLWNLLACGYSDNVNIYDVETQAVVRKYNDAHDGGLINISRFANLSPNLFATSSRLVDHQVVGSASRSRRWVPAHLHCSVCTAERHPVLQRRRPATPSLRQWTMKVSHSLDASY